MLPLALLCLAAPSFASEGYLRTPDVFGDQLVFAAEGDLWLVSVDGGQATRLTTHAGSESNPRFSPDGQLIAFTGSYDGNPDVYVLPVQGGEPRRLTWHPGYDEVMGWMGDRVLFRSHRAHHSRSTELFTVSPGGGQVERVPVGFASALDVDPDSGRWAFNRTSREHRTWKRYRGGRAQDIWVGHPDRADYARVTTFDGTDALPIWHDGRVWFLSDQGGTANLWSMAADGTERTRHTDHERWDVRWPAMGPDGHIAYMLAGGLYLFDPAEGSTREVDVELPSERTLTRHRYPSAARDLTWYDLSPTGDRVLLTTRGEVFSVPVEEHGVTLPISAWSGARESWASYGPEGERIVYVTDASGEESIVTADAWGRGDEEVVLPPGDSGWHFPPTWSPDGEWVAWADQTQTLYLAPVGEERPEGEWPRAVDRSEQGEITEYAWSPDSRWLAYSRTDRTELSSVWVHDRTSGADHRVTGESTGDHSPAWDPEGRYLYFLGERAIDPVLSARDFDYVVTGTTLPYLVPLRPDVDNPFLHDEGLPPDDEPDEEAEEPDRKKKKKRKKGAEDEQPDEGPEPVDIDFEGIQSRALALEDVLPGQYAGLAATKDRVFWLSTPVRGMVDPPTESTLVSWELESKKPKDFLTGVASYELSGNGEKLAVHKGGGEIYVVGTGSPPGDLSEARVALGQVVVDLDPAEEWRQIYLEGWRLMRDFYWEPDLAGVDWVAIRDQYAELLPRLATRDDLRDLMGQVIGELATSHTYVWGGDPGVHAKRIGTGLLGADLVPVDGAWRVERILRGDPADVAVSPLAAPGVGVREGQFVQAVNHRPVPTDRPFEAALENLAGRAVVLTVSDRPSGGAVRDVVVVPVGSDKRLRYVDWVRRNREHVAERSDGRLGYLHIPDMGTRGLVAFETWFYPQLDAEGLVVDVRWNGGGFVSQLLVQRLRRRVLGWDRARHGGLYAYPPNTLNGPFVVLINQFAGSDGDIFPMTIQQEGLAPVLGKRSWGGVVGIRGDKPLVDGAMITQPEFAFWFRTTGWGVENHGVDPDIVVDNLPADLAAGRDPQLDRSIDEALRLLETGQWPEPEFGPAPRKDRDTFRELEGGGR